MGQITRWVCFLFVLSIVLSSAPGASSRSEAVLAEAASSASSPAQAQENSLRITEVMFFPETGNPEWVEIFNSGPQVSLSGYALTDEDGIWMQIPAALPPVPSNGFVVIVLDGSGSATDDYDFGDHVAVVHSPPGLVNFLDDEADQVALYTGIRSFPAYLPLISRGSPAASPSVPAADQWATAHFGQQSALQASIVSFVAWGGDPGADANRAVTALLWAPSSYASIQRSTGFGGARISPGESVGLLPGLPPQYAESWAMYRATETTPGAPNRVPTIAFSDTPSGMIMDSATFSIAWQPVEGASGYHFQLDEDPSFTSPAVDAVLDRSAFVPAQPVPDGAYYWRVKVLTSSGESDWSTTSAVGARALPDVLAARPSPAGAQSVILLASAKKLHIAWQLQHKDTRMLYLDGMPESGRGRWDSAHEEDGDGIAGNSTPLMATSQDYNYCVRASLSMFISFYGGKLSQDRISYEIYKNSAPAGPEGDLGYATPTPTGAQLVAAAEWALNGPKIEGFRDPSFSQIQGWIDNDQPVIANVTLPGGVYHVRIISGYAVIDEQDGSTSEWLTILDPYNPAGLKTVDFPSDTTFFAWIGPAGAGSAPDVISDEDTNGNGRPDTIEDRDGDGVVDFDEINRFHTLAGNPDSDSDGVPDKAEIREYVFNPAGQYSRQQADLGDADLLRKELDPDNDDDGAGDGCEDTNLNGIFEPEDRETSNFDASISQRRQCGLSSGDMVFIPGGPFKMGCDPSNPAEGGCGWSGQSPLHEVEISPFSMDRYEVTNSQYDACVRAGECTAPSQLRSQSRDDYYANSLFADYPVIYVNWHQASAFCQWAGKRLPTEAEWEKAARGAGDTRIYPWGNEPAECSLANFDQNDPICVGDTSRVGGYPAGASPYGLMDMAGNVYEWVNDWYDVNYYSFTPSANPQGPAAGVSKGIRGGDWLRYWYDIRVASRNEYDPNGSNEYTGFRCAASPAGNQPPTFPSNPSPQHLTQTAPVTAVLAWTGGDPDGDPVTYDIYFEPGDATPDVLAADDWTETYFNPGTLAENTTYFWRVVAADRHGAVSAGLVWAFTTRGSGAVPGEMVFIPGGSFKRGCDPAHNGGALCITDALPMRSIILDSYLIGKFEVTNAEYALCVSAGECAEPVSDGSLTRESYFNNPAFAHYPVISITWEDANRYCAWVGGRLPTEAEWEKAARGPGEPRAYPWGDQPPDCSLANGNVCLGDTAALGSYPAGASPYGVMDMAGNAWEWVRDWHQSNYYSLSPMYNPLGPITGTGKGTRGGGFGSSWSYMNASRRGVYNATGADTSLGFRCAADP